MPVILLEKDPFVEITQRAGEDPLRTNVNVRRPVYGISIKQPRFAFLSVYQRTDAWSGTNNSSGDVDGVGTRGDAVSIIDSSAPGGFSDANHNFILQRVQESRQEKIQVVETFGDHFSFFYGEKPIVLAVQGMLFNTADFNWKNEWMANYDRYLRGTKAVENRTRVFLGWDDVIAQGYIINTSVVYDKDMPYVCPFQFSILLTEAPTDVSGGVGAAAAAYRGQTVRSAEEARDWRGGGGDDVERNRLLPDYITEVQARPRTVFDAATGLLKREDLASPDVPESVDNNQSADWITGTKPAEKMWKSEEEALLFLNTELTAEQTGVDKVTVRQALRTRSSDFQLASRNDAVIQAASALRRGVTNVAAVVPDAPVVE